MTPEIIADPTLISAVISMILVIYVIIRDVVAPLVKARTNGNGNGSSSKGSSPPDPMIDRIDRRVDDLYKWHDARDSEGRLLWYTPIGFKRALEQNTVTTQTLTQTIRILIQRLETLEEDPPRRRKN